MLFGRYILTNNYYLMMAISQRQFIFNHSNFYFLLNKLFKIRWQLIKSIGSIFSTHLTHFKTRSKVVGSITGTTKAQHLI